MDGWTTCDSRRCPTERDPPVQLRRSAEQNGLGQLYACRAAFDDSSGTKEA